MAQPTAKFLHITNKILNDEKRIKFNIVNDLDTMDHFMKKIASRFEAFNFEEAKDANNDEDNDEMIKNKILNEQKRIKFNIDAEKVENAAVQLRLRINNGILYTEIYDINECLLSTKFDNEELDGAETLNDENFNITRTCDILNDEIGAETPTDEEMNGISYSDKDGIISYNKKDGIEQEILETYGNIMRNIKPGNGISYSDKYGIVSYNEKYGIELKEPDDSGGITHECNINNDEEKELNIFVENDDIMCNIAPAYEEIYGIELGNYNVISYSNETYDIMYDNCKNEFKIKCDDIAKEKNNSQSQSQQRQNHQLQQQQQLPPQPNQPNDSINKVMYGKPCNIVSGTPCNVVSGKPCNTPPPTFRNDNNVAKMRANLKNENKLLSAIENNKLLSAIENNAIYDIKAAETPVEKVLSESLGAGTPVEKVLVGPGALENELNIKINDIDPDIKDSGQMAVLVLNSESEIQNDIINNQNKNNEIDIFIYKKMILLCFIAYSIDQSDIKDPTNLYLGIVLAVVVILTGIFGYYQELKSADVSIIDCTPDREIDKSSLTPSDETPTESANLCFFGTLVVNGKGRGVVIATGDETFMDRIAQLATSTEGEETPIAKEIKDFVFKVSLIAFVLGVTFFIIGMVENDNLVANVVFLIGIIVSNVPEGLLATITVSVILTARRMFDKNVRVKNLESIDTLGLTLVICSDKTGTLTTNVMTCQHVYYDLKECECDTDNPLAAVKVCCGALCNNAEFIGGDIVSTVNATKAVNMYYNKIDHYVYGKMVLKQTPTNASNTACGIDNKLNKEIKSEYQPQQQQPPPPQFNNKINDDPSNNNKNRSPENRSPENNPYTQNNPLNNNMRANSKKKNEPPPHFPQINNTKVRDNKLVPVIEDNEKYKVFIANANTTNGKLIIKKKSVIKCNLTDGKCILTDEKRSDCKLNCQFRLLDEDILCTLWCLISGSLLSYQYLLLNLLKDIIIYYSPYNKLFSSNITPLLCAIIDHSLICEVNLGQVKENEDAEGAKDPLRALTALCCLFIIILSIIISCNKSLEQDLLRLLEQDLLRLLEQDLLRLLEPFEKVQITGLLIGASIRQYLLGEIRVIHQNSNERNFHRFYFICSGVDKIERERFSVTEACDYYDTHQNGIYDLPMNTAGITPPQIFNIMKLMSGILWLGNIAFENFNILNENADDKKMDGSLNRNESDNKIVYFVSNPALLLILSQACFAKVFDSITRVEFDETFAFLSLSTNGNIEEWFLAQRQETKLPYKTIIFICDVLEKNLVLYSENVYGCRVVQSFINNKLNINKLFDNNAYLFLLSAKCSNYVMQCIINKNRWYPNLSQADKFRNQLINDIFKSDGNILCNDKYVRKCILKVIKRAENGISEQQIIVALINYSQSNTIKIELKLTSSFRKILEMEQTSELYQDIDQIIRQILRIRYKIDKNYNELGDKLIQIQLWHNEENIALYCRVIIILLIFIIRNGLNELISSCNKTHNNICARNINELVDRKILTVSIIFLPDCSGLQMNLNFENNIYCTFIGIDLLFDNIFVENVSKCKGYNCSSVYSENEYINKLYNDLIAFINEWNGTNHDNKISIKVLTIENELAAFDVIDLILDKHNNRMKLEESMQIQSLILLFDSALLNIQNDNGIFKRLTQLFDFNIIVMDALKCISNVFYQKKENKEQQIEYLLQNNKITEILHRLLLAIFVFIVVLLINKENILTDIVTRILTRNITLRKSDINISPMLLVKFLSSEVSRTTDKIDTSLENIRNKLMKYNQIPYDIQQINRIYALMARSDNESTQNLRDMMEIEELKVVNDNIIDEVKKYGMVYVNKIDIYMNVLCDSNLLNDLIDKNKELTDDNNYNDINDIMTRSRTKQLKKQKDNNDKSNNSNSELLLISFHHKGCTSEQLTSIYWYFYDNKYEISGSDSAIIKEPLIYSITKQYKLNELYKFSIEKYVEYFTENKSMLKVLFKRLLFTTEPFRELLVNNVEILKKDILDFDNNYKCKSDLAYGDNKLDEILQRKGNNIIIDAPGNRISIDNNLGNLLQVLQNDIIIDKRNKQSLLAMNGTPVHTSTTNENMNKICVYKTVKALSVDMTTIITFGLLMIVCSNIKATQSVNSISCISWHWLFGLGGILLIMSPLLKAPRVSRVFLGGKMLMSMFIKCAIMEALVCIGYSVIHELFGELRIENRIENQFDDNSLINYLSIGINKVNHINDNIKYITSKQFINMIRVLFE